MFILLMRAALFAIPTVFLSAANPSNIDSLFPWRKTKQHVPATCFSNFENLYFSNPSATFFTVGKDIKLLDSINISDIRGYFWEENPPLTFSLKTITTSATSIFIFERDATPNHSIHFFHCLEHLLGIWNFGGAAKRLDVKLFVLANNGRASPQEWMGQNAVAYHLIKALFPHAEIKTWDQFMEKNRGAIVCFEKAITSDRSMEIFKNEPYYTERMLGGYFQNLKKELLDQLASYVWQYSGAFKTSSDKTKITYVKRASSRILAPNCEKELLKRIGQLTNTELQVVDFAAMTFQEQIQVVANTDILLGVHGNGFSHTLFLPNGATVIELFPKNSLRVEYRILANARELHYFGWVDQRGWIDDRTAETLGCHGRVDVEEVQTNVPAIIELLEALH